MMKAPPDTSRQVVCYVRFMREWFMGRFSDGEWHVYDVNIRDNTDVIAWEDLPEDPVL